MKFIPTNLGEAEDFSSLSAKAYSQSLSKINNLHENSAGYMACFLRRSRVGIATAKIKELTEATRL
jgi:hypothetical protein